MKKEEIKILLVDDEPDILEIVGYNLKKEGFQIFTASNGIKAIEKAKKNNFQLIILDIMMPEINGIETCIKIREIASLQEVIIAFFTARNEDYSQIAGYEAGADDYITKPINPKILVSKVNGLLRRYLVKKENKNKIITLRDLIINKTSYLVKQNNKTIILPKKEFELLFFLATNLNKVIKREEIMNTVWGTNVVVGNRTIDVHVRKLRQKLGSNYIITIKGVGYKFVE